MEIHLVAKDELEASGIRWVVESHFTGINLVSWKTMGEFEKAIQKQQPDLVIFDMDHWKNESERFGELIQKFSIRWLGISSERIFQTAYLALQYRAEDVLFRPFSPTDLIKHIQQLRYQIRNNVSSFTRNINEEISSLNIDYPDLFLNERMYEGPITMVAFLTPNSGTLPFVYKALERNPFTGKNRLFVGSDFILCVHEADEEVLLQDEYNAFLARWKEMMDEPLAIVMKVGSMEETLKDIFEQTLQLTRRIFFEGYDIILAENEPMPYQEKDPFLTPLEQRHWIEMLERRDAKAIRDWMEREFLTFQQPYPDPEIVRIRLTSVLAQIRRYMKSNNLQNALWEGTYYDIFQKIVHGPIIYQIVQELLDFTTNLLLQGHDSQKEGHRTLVEKTRELIESNYWDAGWSLTECADALRINKSTLSRRFAAESNQSFRETLHEVRIREAKRLLDETDIPLDEISRLIGYSHQSYFNAKFKQLEGCTPLVYRSGL
ncbi:response regulator transcription factor [Gottfriedia acidiceleris]|uniref:response regulator transcription factor n=1 Tax=Gottfriedia acidiceleris TaxID=371036 RepID=UPI000B432869|nr:response regulator transcription factor [Gottfriedia acidiceleris]